MGALRNVLIVSSAVLIAHLIGCAGLHETAPKGVSLDSSVVDAIRDAVYEVVVLKPAKDSLRYERPLPMDLLPYSVRTDKYESFGTAFAISPSEFVSASHVMTLGTGSQFKEMFLRDRGGKVYPIDKVLKYSKNRDFVVFSLRDGTAKRFLPVNRNPRVHQRVYAVGNALGEGIVIRDGLYTSDTPEEETGEWKWIRFSAAASPGNSGGPLLDQSGNVIGIVLRKSQNENLNYAVPIAEVLNVKKNAAVVQEKMRYGLDNMDMTKIDTLRKEIPLPKTYEELDREINTIMTQFADKLLKDLLAENRDAIFPYGQGSTQLLYKRHNAVSPRLIMKGRDGTWDAYQPRDLKDFDLGKNGRLKYGTLSGTAFLYVHKPDDIPLETFYGDSKLFMDLILKGGGHLREVGPEYVKITSMGSAFEDYRFTDSYGRIWIVRTWLIEYDDRKVVTLSLPVPGGCIVMMKTSQTGSIDQEEIPDLKVLSDFVYVAYHGTLKEWREFLDLRDYLPSIFSTIDIRFENNGGFRYRSARLSLSCGPDLMKISDKSTLELDFGYFQDHDRTVWDINGILITEDQFNQIVCSLYRTVKPPKELGDQYQTVWETMAERRFPYNRSSYYKDQFTTILTTYHRDGASERGDVVADSVLYSVGLFKQGNIDQKEMESKLDTFMHNLVVYETPGSR